MSNLSLVSTKALRSVEVTLDTVSGTVESLGAVVGIANTYVSEKAKEFRANSKFREREFKAKAIHRLASIQQIEADAGKALLDFENNKDNKKYLDRAKQELANIELMLAE